MVVPFNIPEIFLILFKKIDCLITLIIGIPPATAASYSNKTLFFSAISNNSVPCLHNKALFAVTKFIFFSNYFFINSKLNPFS